MQRTGTLNNVDLWKQNKETIHNTHYTLNLNTLLYQTNLNLTINTRFFSVEDMTSYTIYSTKTRYKHLESSNPLNPQQYTLSKPVESVTPTATDHLNSQFQSKNHSQLRPKPEKLAFAKHQIVKSYASKLFSWN